MHVKEDVGRHRQARRLAERVAKAAESFASYHRAARTLAASRGSSTLRVWLLLVRARTRDHVGPFHFCLFSVDGEPPASWDEYIRHAEFEPAQSRWNAPDMRSLVKDKLQFHRRCRMGGLATVPLVGVIGAAGASIDYPELDSSEALDVALQAEPADAFFFKPSHGAHGTGAFTLRRRPGGYEFGGERGDAARVLAHARALLPPGQSYLVQPRLHNAEALQPIMSPSGLGTARIVTYLAGGEVVALCACLRITAGANVTDNFSSGSAGNLTAAIDLETGRLGPAIGSRDRRWPDMRTVTTHPDTGTPIEGFAVPCWEDVTALARRAHANFPELGSIGWDIAITEAGPLLIEGNHAWDLNLLQVAHRQGLRSRLRAAMAAA